MRETTLRQWRRPYRLVLYQFVRKLTQICYIQFCYIQFRVNFDTFGYKFVSKIQNVLYHFVHKITAKKKTFSLKKNGPPWSLGTREYVNPVQRSMKYMQNTWKNKYTICISTVSGNVHTVNLFCILQHVYYILDIYNLYPI